MKYIDADKLIAEIERLYDIARDASYNGEIEGEMTAYDKILSIITSLQPEQHGVQNGKFVFPKYLYARTKDNKTIDMSYAPQDITAVEYIRNELVEQEQPEGNLEYWLEHFGMPKENIDYCITQIAQGYGACRYLEGVQHGAEAVNELAQQEQPETDMKSPFTGGKVAILSRQEEVTFRGEKVKITCKYYRCEDTGREFTDSKLDDDMMWAVFRAYCEKKGMTSFTDIMLKQEQPSLPSNLDEAELKHVEFSDYPPASQEEELMVYNAFKAGAEWMAGQVMMLKWKYPEEKYQYPECLTRIMDEYGDWHYTISEGHLNPDCEYISLAELSLRLATR